MNAWPCVGVRQVGSMYVYVMYVYMCDGGGGYGDVGVGVVGGVGGVPSRVKI